MSKPTGEPCEVCGTFVSGFKYRYCCAGAINLCDCGGDPVEHCLCDSCNTDDEPEDDEEE